MSTVVAAPVPLEGVATVVVDDPDDPPFAPGVPGVVVDGTGPPTTVEVDPGLTATVPVGATVVAGVTVVVDATVLIVTDVALVALTGPVLDAPSVTEFAPSRATTVPSEEHTTDTVIDDDVLDADGVNTQPDAVPVFEKSPEAIPDTASSKVNV